jgi:hypothetical protein
MFDIDPIRVAHYRYAAFDATVDFETDALLEAPTRHHARSSYACSRVSRLPRRLRRVPARPR